MLGEEEFVKSALQFLEEIGADTSVVQPETNLFETKVLDSLGTLAFLSFLEEQRGEEIEIENLDIRTISSIRNAYHFLSTW